MRTSAIRQSLLLTCALALASFTPRAFGAQTGLFRLARESVLETEVIDAGQTNVQSGPVTGTMWLQQRPSPLDWDVYEIHPIRWESALSPGGMTEIRGQGQYTVGGRFEYAQQIQLNLRIGAQAAVLSSGSVRVPDDTVPIRITAHGSTTNGTARTAYWLHILAYPVKATWTYRLIEGSTLLEECSVCDRPSIPQVLRGGFDLVLIDENPFATRYHLFDIHFSAGAAASPDYVLTGESDAEIRGEVAVTESWVSILDVQSPSGQKSITLTNDPALPRRSWPNLSVAWGEEDSTPLSAFYLVLNAAPFRELWFITANGLTSGTLPAPENRVEAGDIITDTGRVVKRQAELLESVGVTNSASDVRLDAFDLNAAYRFSVADQTASASLGSIRDGDLLTSAGSVLLRYEDLLQPFGIMPPVADAGLDAFQFQDDTDAGPWPLFFSIRRNQFSERLGRTLGHGDVLEIRRGSPEFASIRKTNRELLASFKPSNPEHDYGLDALYLWPHGEIWFSTQEDFTSGMSESITHGDLLSDQGFVVYRNLELVGPFAPLEDLSNFGLHGAFVITDIATSTGWQLFSPQLDFVTHSARLSWRPLFNSRGIFQVERADHAGDSFKAVSPIIVETEWIDAEALPGRSSALYRLRHW